MKNLVKIAFAGRFNMTTDILAMLNRANGETYPLSIPLIIAGVMGSRHYPAIRDSMIISLQTAGMNSSTNRSFKAWMLGRLIQADIAIGNNIAPTVQELKTLLTDLSLEHADSFATWAWGYLAYADYEYAKENMLKTATELHAPISDQLWAWVMNTQAAAQAKDKITYLHCLEQIKKITRQPTVGEALMSGLTRDEKSNNNDFPAWAMAIVYSSAQMIGDNALMEELTPALKTSKDQAKQIVAARSKENPEFANKVLAEQHLAEVISLLAQERQYVTPTHEVKNHAPQ